MSSGPRSQNASRATTHEIQVTTPYRLDLTVSALRRMATNVVDVYTAFDTSTPQRVVEHVREFQLGFTEA
jgi:hypothetical protein